MVRCGVQSQLYGRRKQETPVSSPSQTRERWNARRCVMGTTLTVKEEQDRMMLGREIFKIRCATVLGDSLPAT